MQDKLDERFYTTTLQFTHDLCRAVGAGINTAVKPSPTEEPGAEAAEASPSKQSSNYADVKDRRRLGKRILKTAQPHLEAALKAESEICSKPLDALLKELEGMIEASLEIRQPTITVSHDEADVAPEKSQDVKMTDAPEEAQIIVADQSEVDGDAGHGPDAEADGEPDDPMDTDAPPPIRHGGSNIEVNTSVHEDGVSSKPNGAVSSDGSAASGEDLQLQQQQPSALPNQDREAEPMNGFTKTDSGSPPSLSNFGPPAVGLQPPQHSGPLTPPQSTGSFGRDPANVLTEGGIPWYLQGFHLLGTSAVEEQWVTGREAVRSLSEELTDMDDDALKDLEFDVDDDTITASPVNAENGGNGGGGTGHEAKMTLTPGGSARKRERANPAKFRKGVRSSARRR